MFKSIEAVMDTKEIRNLGGAVGEGQTGKEMVRVRLGSEEQRREILRREEDLRRKKDTEGLNVEENEMEIRRDSKGGGKGEEETENWIWKILYIEDYTSTQKNVMCGRLHNHIPMFF